MTKRETSIIEEIKRDAPELMEIMLRWINHECQEGTQ